MTYCAVSYFKLHPPGHGRTSIIARAAVAFSVKSGLPPEIRLLVITGLLGGLTTFSTFSAEVVSLLERAHFGWALTTAGVHLSGSLL